MNTQHEQFDTLRLNAISISEVARRLGDTVHRVGVNHVSLCPWHDDHHPSLSLVEGTGKNYCHCFSCGKGGDVISFVMQHEGWTFQDACQWLSSTFGICTTLAGGHVPQPKPRPMAKPVEPTYTYIPTEMLDKLVSAESSLCRCLMRMFQPEAVEWLAEEYRIGCYPMNGLDDYTVFPSIDHQGRVCNLKVQHYETDPHFDRFGHSDQAAYWLGAIWMREGRLPAGAVFRSDCLFGEHLLPRYPNSVVALVESPKNALFGALAFPQWLWVATGNKGNLKRQSLLTLRGRDIIVIPDGDAVEEWTAKVSDMKDLANFTVSDFCRRMAPEGQPKYDIADYLQQQLFQPVAF
jgi:hypothetical protein